MIKILMNGAAGKMGRAMSKGLLNTEGIEVVAAVDIVEKDKDLGTLCGLAPNNILLEDNLKKAIEDKKPNIIVDFTNPQTIYSNIEVYQEHKLPSVIGTTGLSDDEQLKLNEMALKNNTPIFLGANFALGAVLMMRLSKEAAKYFADVEIIERHHDQKLDAPSGTAIETARLISQVRQEKVQGNPAEKEEIKGSRGGDFEGMKIHSMRLPGYVANQEVVFGGLGQTLTIKHDTINRDSFLPGVVMAVKAVQNLKGLVVGLDNIL